MSRPRNISLSDVLAERGNVMTFKLKRIEVILVGLVYCGCASACMYRGSHSNPSTASSLSPMVANNTPGRAGAVDYQGQYHQANQPSRMASTNSPGMAVDVGYQRKRNRENGTTKMVSNNTPGRTGDVDKQYHQANRPHHDPVWHSDSSQNSDGRRPLSNPFPSPPFVPSEWGENDREYSNVTHPNPFTQTATTYEASLEEKISPPPVGTILSNRKSEVRFVSSNKTAEPIHSPSGFAAEKLITERREYYSNNRTNVIHMSRTPSRTYPSHGFIQSVVFAYKNHHNLVLRPDDIWTAILVQFSIYVNRHAETLRSTFVSHSGKRALTVRLPYSGGLRSLNHFAFLTQMSQLVLDSLHPDTADWIMPNFTTTTDTDRMVGGVVLMATMQKYFDYKLETACGIPEITLQGTLEDWKDILNRITRLESFGMTAWSRMLTPILQHFIDAKKGQVDKFFWSDICRLSANYLGEKDAQIDGWITAFSVFGSDGKWQGGVQDGSEWPRIDLHNLASGVVTVPVAIVENNYGSFHTHEAVMLAGHLGQSTLGFPHGLTLQPYSGWGIILK